MLRALVWIWIFSESYWWCWTSAQFCVEYYMLVHLSEPILCLLCTQEGKDKAFLLKLLQEASKRAALKPPARKPYTSQPSLDTSSISMPVPESRCLGNDINMQWIRVAMNKSWNTHREPLFVRNQEIFTLGYFTRCILFHVYIFVLLWKTTLNSTDSFLKSSLKFDMILGFQSLD